MREFVFIRPFIRLSHYFTLSGNLKISLLSIPTCMLGSGLGDIDVVLRVWNVPKSELYPLIRVPKPMLGGAASLEEAFYGCLNSNSDVM